MSAGIGAADAAIYTGICVESTDPTGQGRIQYQVPQLSGTAAFGWASPVSPGVTAVGDYVYIAFEGGDRNRPLYWPADPVPPYVPPPISYPTYAALLAANPIATAPSGTTFYVVDHGGYIQLQDEGTGSLGYQPLPSGYQSSGTNAGDVSTSSSTAALVATAALNNPSAKRQYRISVDSQVWTSSGGGPLAGLALITSTSTPPSTLPAFTTSFIVVRAANVGFNSAGVSAGSAVALSYSHVVTNLGLGALNVSVYLMNSYGNSNTVTTSSGQTQIVVDDIGASL
jgi:hypothetical protein